MQSRKWFIRITKENETANGIYIYDYDTVYNTLIGRYSKVALVQEVGTETEKEHAHILLQNDTAIRFDTLKKIMPYGDIQVQRGTVIQCVDYMSKENSIKSNVEMTDFADADIQGKRNDLTALYAGLQAGKSTYEIIEENNAMLLSIDKIERARQLILSEKFRKVLRLELKTNTYYVSGATGTGKTSSIFEKYGYENVYRVTDYTHPFDNYSGECVIVFEEFRNSLKIEEMLNLLDIYPLSLPARYGNKVACYTSIYICSNWTLIEQYKKTQSDYPATWKALLRRISCVRQYTDYGVYKDSDVLDYILSTQEIDKLPY